VIVELQLNLPGIEKVHLKVLIMAMPASRPKAAIRANDW
jgi:uncharacterized membrane protein